VTSVGKGNGADSAGWRARCALRGARQGGGRKGDELARVPEHDTARGDAGADARSRIGKGPWQNAKGVVVAKSVSDLHSDHNNVKSNGVDRERAKRSKAAAIRRTSTTS